MEKTRLLLLFKETTRIRKIFRQISFSYELEFAEINCLQIAFFEILVRSTIRSEREIENLSDNLSTEMCMSLLSFTWFICHQPTIYIYLM